MSKRWEASDFFIGEEDFEARMNSDLAEFRKARYIEGIFLGSYQKPIHYIYVKAKQERAAVVISHGFCEFVRKYEELIYYLYQLGYSVYMPEHCGHGYSYRVVEDWDKVHIDDFKVYVKDFDLFIQNVVKVNSPKSKLLLFAHSMGGCIGALYLEEQKEVFSAAVLSSPMLEVSFGKVPKAIASIILRVAVLFGKKEEYVTGKHAFDNVYAFSASSTLSEPRYAYVFKLRQQVREYRTYGGTFGWTLAAQRAAKKAVRNAKKVVTPTLLVQAGQDSLVKPEGQLRFARASSDIRLIRYEESKHEVFNALTPIREAYYKEVFSFLETHVE